MLHVVALQIETRRRPEYKGVTAVNLVGNYTKGQRLPYVDAPDLHCTFVIVAPSCWRPFLLWVGA